MHCSRPRNSARGPLKPAMSVLWTNTEQTVLLHEKKHIFKNIYLTTSRVKRVHPIWCNGKPVLHTARLLLCSRWSSGDTRLTVLRHRGQQLCITVWTVVQAVLTLTFNSYGDRQISTPYKINTPEPIDKKIGTVDYVREGTLYTKFDTNPPTGCFWANGWNITKKYFLFILYFSGSRTGQTRGWIFTCDSSKVYSTVTLLIVVTI